MSDLLAEAQAHLLVAFQLHVPAADLIPPDARYRMYAEKVVHRPLPEWQALSLEEARTVYRHLTRASPQAPPTPDTTLDILRRVSRRQPLHRDDHTGVLALIDQELMHVTPEFDRTDPCPYRLTAAGQAALRSGGTT